MGVQCTDVQPLYHLSHLSFWPGMRCSPAVAVPQLPSANPSALPAVQSLCYVGRDNPHLVPALHRWNAAFTPALASYLRQKQHYLDDHLAAVLPEAELEWLKARGSPPIAVLQVGRHLFGGS